MRRHFSFLWIILFMVSCGPDRNRQQNQTVTDGVSADSAAVLNDPKNNLNIQMNSFSEIDSSGILMFPLSMGESERSGSSLSYKEVPGSCCWNLIFFNSTTNEYHLLSERKMLIRNYDFQDGSDDNTDVTQTHKYICYRITSDDYNKDRKLTDEDPDYLFVSDKEGKHFRQISPSGYDIQNWRFVKSANKVLMTVKKDSDKNNKFDDNDEVTTFEVEIDKETEPHEVFSTDFKNKLKVLYDRDWKRLK